MMLDRKVYDVDKLWIEVYRVMNYSYVVKYDWLVTEREYGVDVTIPEELENSNGNIKYTREIDIKNTLMLGSNMADYRINIVVEDTVVRLVVSTYGNIGVSVEVLDEDLDPRFHRVIKLNTPLADKVNKINKRLRLVNNKYSRVHTDGVNLYKEDYNRVYDSIDLIKCIENNRNVKDIKLDNLNMDVERIEGLSLDRETEIHLEWFKNLKFIGDNAFRQWIINGHQKHLKVYLGDLDIYFGKLVLDFSVNTDRQVIVIYTENVNTYNRLIRLLENNKNKNYSVVIRSLSCG